MSQFTKTIIPAKGLRPTKRNPRNTQFLTTCSGAVGRDNMLQVLEEITRLATDVITDSFPYPQIFVFNRMIIICGETTIYEWESGMVEKITGLEPGSTWRAIESFNYAFLSNGVVSVVRDTGSFTYSISTDVPICNSICNYNGQILVGGFKE
ncbi:MAG: hypothetical protein DRH93_03290 [Deltaproteobacteria bacterium]|nr:MAG: hypothetical protein DRH93_03290 [Deltaproteobacteria bacterium]